MKLIRNIITVTVFNIISYIGLVILWAEISKELPNVFRYYECVSDDCFNLFIIWSARLYFAASLSLCILWLFIFLLRFIKRKDINDVHIFGCAEVLLITFLSFILMFISSL